MAGSGPAARLTAGSSCSFRYLDVGVMNRTALATITGLVLGLALVFGSFGDMLIVALFGAIGYGVAKILDGDIDAQAWLARARRNR